MRKLFLFALLYALWLPRIAMSQTIAILNQQYVSTCVGATVSLSISTSGTFATANAFRVELTTDNGSSAINLPAVMAGTVLTFTVPASATSANGYRYRVFSTNPVVYSEQSSQLIMVSRPPTAQLTSNSVNTLPVNSYERVDIPVNLTGGSPYTLVMQDGTTQKNDGYSRISVFPVQTTSYSIVSVQNSCGAGTSEGSTTVLVNERNIKAALGKPVNLCDDSPIPVYFATDGPLPAGITFEAQLYDPINSKLIASLPVSGTASPLSLTIPASLMQSDMSQPYRVLIQAENRALSFWYPGEGNNIYRTPANPRLSLMGSATVAFGQPTSLYVDYANAAGGTVVLNNGRKVPLNLGPNGRLWIPVAIDRTTSFSIASYESACNRTPVYENRSVQLVVLPGMRIDSLSAEVICEGKPVTLYYSTTPGFTVPGSVRLRTAATQWTEAIQTQPGQLTFVAPMRLPEGYYDDSIELRDPVSNSLLTGSSVRLFVKGKTRAAILQPYYPEIPEPGTISIGFSLTGQGGSSSTVTLNTGQVFVLDTQTFPSFVTQTTAFSVVATRNECGVDSTRSSAQWIVRNPSSSPRIVLRPGTITQPASKSFAQRIVCPGKAFWINPTVSGTFAADNRFQLEIADADGNFTAPPSLTTSAPVAMSIAWPGVAQTLLVRLSSTNPVVRSEPLTLQNYYRELTIALRNEQVGSGISLPSSGTVASGQVIQLTYVVNGAPPISYELANPQALLTSDYVYYPFAGNQITLSATWQTSTSGLYGLRSIRDACGYPVAGQSAKQITVVSSAIVTGIPTVICANLQAQVPFSQTGTVPQNTTFVVQASLDQVTWQTLPTSGMGSPLSTQFPVAFADQRAYYRVVGLLPDGNSIIGTASASIVFTPPTLRIGGVTAQSVVAGDSYGFGSFAIEAVNPVTEPRTVLIRNMNTGRVENVSNQDRYYFTSPGTYSIVSASNQCGYGSGIGSVRVVQRPTLRQFATNKTAYCTGESVVVAYAATDLTPDNALSLYLMTDGRSTKTLLTQTTVASGTYSFSLNPTMTPGSYSLVYESTLPVELLNQVATFTVQNPLSLTLGPARAAVYADAVPTLPLIVNTNAGPYSFTLSTPSGVSTLTGTYTSVLPLLQAETGTYALLGATNQCGAGRVTGAASITVLPIAAVRIEIDPKATTALPLLCVGKAYTLPISTSGAFGTGNVFTAYLTDSTGVTRLALPTTGKGDALTITVPANAPAGDGYLLRVGSSEPTHLGATLRNVVQVRAAPTAVLTGDNTIMKGDSTRLLLSMTGAGPWQLTIADTKGLRSFIAAQSPYSLPVRPDTTTSYRLTEVRNSQCGVGTASGTALIAVSRLLASEPLAMQVRVWPNPTAGRLQLAGELPTDGLVQVSLHTLLGTLVQSTVVKPDQGRVQHELDLSQLPSGLYMLTAEQQGRRSQFKIVKY